MCGPVQSTIRSYNPRCVCPKRYLRWRRGGSPRRARYWPRCTYWPGQASCLHLPSAARPFQPPAPHPHPHPQPRLRPRLRPTRPPRLIALQLCSARPGVPFRLIAPSPRPMPLPFRPTTLRLRSARPRVPSARPRPRPAPLVFRPAPPGLRRIIPRRRLIALPSRLTESALTSSTGRVIRSFVPRSCTAKSSR